MNDSVHQLQLPHRLGLLHPRAAGVELAQARAPRASVVGVFGMAIAVVGDALPPRDRHLHLDHPRPRHRLAHRRSHVDLDPDDQDARTNRALARVRRSGCGPGRHLRVLHRDGGHLSVVTRSALGLEVFLGFSDLHRQLDGLRQAAGLHHRRADHLQGPELHRTSGCSAARW